MWHLNICLQNSCQIRMKQWNSSRIQFLKHSHMCIQWCHLLCMFQSQLRWLQFHGKCQAFHWLSCSLQEFCFGRSLNMFFIVLCSIMNQKQDGERDSIISLMVFIMIIQRIQQDLLCLWVWVFHWQDCCISHFSFLRIHGGMSFLQVFFLDIWSMMECILRCITCNLPEE